MLMFCVSGVILNHRSLFANVNVSRAYLPSRYSFQKWNGGLLRGTLRIDDRVLIYGTGGMWLTDATGKTFDDFNDGLPAGADFRQIRDVVSTGNSLFAVSPFALYRYDEHNQWHTVALPTDVNEKLTDLTLHGDTLVVLSRSQVYVALPPYSAFKRITIAAPKNHDSRATAFRTVWLLHSGELFGTAGKLLVDAIAILLVLLCATGILYWLLPKFHKGGKAIKWSFLLHDRVGRYTIILTLLITITGWCLRPPVMIALAKSKVPAIPGTILRSKNAWNDKLRMVRYDDQCGDWLLSTSEGFYSLGRLDATPQKISNAPSVSVMGLNVWQKDQKGQWLCGSFSGLTVWNRQKNTSTDYFTHQPTLKQSGMPFGNVTVSGFSQDFKGKPFVVEYYNGTTKLAQPASLNQLPMSLWNVALEIHSGRIYIGTLATLLFIFFAGLLSAWCLWSGYKIRQRLSR